jgi:hypothetical protein
MAYINGNKPIVTDGLIYALDFGNSRCYTSGSTQATSLAYDRATTSISGSPAFNNDLLDFTSTKFIKRDGSLPALDPNGTFTVMFVGNSTGAGTFLRQDTLNSTINPTSSLFGFGLDSGDFSRSYPGFTSSSLQHVTYRYSEGTIDTFINGIPITASVANASLTSTAVSNALFIGSGSAGFSGSLAQFYVYNRALSTDEIYTTYLVSAERNGLPTVPKPYTQDENVYKYVQTTGITDLDTISAIDTFVSNLKSNGLWNKMTAIYPFLTTLTGSQAINLKDPGVLGLGLTGSFTGSNVGLTPASSTAYVDTLPSNIPYPSIDSASAHLSLLSYDVPQGNGFLAGNSAPAVGGNLIVSSGSRIYHVYRNVGTSSFYMTNPSITNVEVLVVAGGGAGGTQVGGGGGAGGLILSSSFIITPNSNIEVIVGAGGVLNLNGENSKFSTIESTGGGRGGIYQNGVGASGGSGGGAGCSTGAYVNSGSGVPGQGNDGGSGLSIYVEGAGGGGGAGSKGENAGTIPQKAGDGGSGSYFPQYQGINLGYPAGWFAGGGGGSNAYAKQNDINFRGNGGIGGGGDGSTFRSTGHTLGTPGKPNTGGGGGGRGYNETFTDNSGGSGIVIVSYDLPASALTGSGTGFYLTDSALTASVNSQFTSGITGSGTIGFLTVNRNISSSFSIHKNNISQSISAAASASLSSDIFFNTANLAGSGSLPQPTSISYASIGAGLTDSEVSTYYNLVSQFQTNLKRQNTLLDNYSGAAAAYSLRRIGPSGYFGPAIRVRRDSDNTLRDIGFTSDGQLDTVGLLDFVGVTGSGFVQTWYDQSTGGYNATQNTAGSQPLIIISGSVYTDRNKPAIYSPDKVLNSPSLPAHDYLSLYIVSSVLTDPNTVGWFRIGTSPIYRILIGYDFAPGYTFYTKGGVSTAWQSPISLNSQTVYSIDANTDNFLAYVNNASLVTTTRAGVMGGGTNFIIGNTAGFGSSPANFQEIIYYTSSRRDINTTLNNTLLSAYTTGSDPDYQSFITATGITQPTQSAALETLVSDLKSYGLWNKMKAIYPMVTDRNNRFAQSEDFSSTWNAQSASVSPNQIAAPDGTTTGDLILDVPPTETTYIVNGDGSNYYFTSSIDGPIGGGDPTLILEKGKTYIFNITAPGVHPFYILTGSGYTAGGVYNDGVSGYGTSQITFVVPESAPTPLYYGCSVHLNMTGQLTINENSSEHYIYQTIDGATGIVSGSEYVLSTYAKFYNTPYIAFKTNVGAQAWFDVQTGATGSYTGSNATITNVGNGWYRCALYFTSSETTGPYNQQIHLARTDNDLTFAGTGTSGSYLWGAQFENGNLLGPYRKTEGSGFAVSGSDSMLDQMKFNLKDPVDTDAGFRLTFSGSLNRRIWIKR